MPARPRVSSIDYWWSVLTLNREDGTAEQQYYLAFIGLCGTVIIQGDTMTKLVAGFGEFRHIFDPSCECIAR
jgi:hypothetical protein